MRKGSALPLLLIVTLFLMVPAVYWYIGYRDSVNNVKGAKTSEIEYGLYVTITSNKGTWDLNSYLCKSKSECLESLDSGNKLDTRSGGRAVEYEVDLVYSEQWANYSFLKIFVKPGWGAQERVFKVLNPGLVQGTTVEKITSDGVRQEVVLIPVKELKAGFIKSADFSD